MIWMMTCLYLLMIRIIQMTDCFLNNWSILISTSQRRKKKHIDCYWWINMNHIICVNLLNIAIRSKLFRLISQLISLISCSLWMWWFFSLWNINTMKSSRKQWLTKMRRLSKWNFWMHLMHSESKLSKISRFDQHEKRLSLFHMICLWFWSSYQAARQQMSYLLSFIRTTILTTCLIRSKN